jgi:hypothetical protein
MSWECAAIYRDRAVAELREVRLRYLDADLDPKVKHARLVSIDRKIDALEGVLIPTAAHYPWSEDGVDA